VDTYEQLCREVEDLPAEAEGVTMSHLLALPDPLGETLRRLVRRRSANAAQFAQALRLSEGEAAQLLQLLLERGYVKKVTREETLPCYKIHFAPKFSSAHTPDRLWQALDDL
jgi:hypothetical protein